MKLYKIANIVTEIESYGRTDEQAFPYLYNSNEPAQISLCRTRIDATKNKILKKFPDLIDNDAEYRASSACFYSSLSLFDGMMLHSSAVVVDGKAYLFTADSGTGKSTHTSLWLKMFGDRAYILNDDKPALRWEDGAWYAYGTPWSGKHDISVNARVPLGGIAVLERAEQNSIEPYTDEAAADFFCKQIQKTYRPDRMGLILEILDKLLSTAPIWKLKCNMDPEAAIVSYEAMSGERFER